jgi:serine protease
MKPFVAGVPLVAALSLSVTGVAHAGGPAEAAETTWTYESDWDIPGEWVVDFKDDVEPGAISTLLTQVGATFQPTWLEPDTRIQLVQAPLALAPEMVRVLQADERVESIEPHARVRALFVPDDPRFKEQWHMSRVQAESAWGLSVGRGATVAVIDTGIACESIDGFKKASDLAETRCVAGHNFVNPRKPPSDDHGHGTHVAGTIAQSTDNGLGVAGLAFGAWLMPVKVLSADGWGTTTGVADGIRWAADHGAHVINLSLGGPRNSTVLQSAVDYARARGSVVVASAGNSAGKVGFPGGCEGAVGVSATDSSDKLAWFSSRGTGVDIAAPGVNVLQQTICNRGRNGCEQFSFFNGTSMSSPHVAAGAALLVSLGVTDPDAVESLLFEHAKKIDDSADGRAKYGNGLLQAADAARAVVTKQTTTRFAALVAWMVLALAWARRRGQSHGAASLGLWLGGITAGVGLLFFAPWLLSRHLLWVDVLSRPLGEWDMLVGMSFHRFLPLANVFVPLALSAVLLRVKVAAPWLAGIAIGTAAYLTSVAVLGQLNTPFGTVLTWVWCGLNALGCAYLASLLLSKR